MAERRKRREWEAEYVSEYAATLWPREPKIFHTRLGTWPSPLTEEELSPEEQRMLMVRMRWADALIILAQEIKLLEAKLRPSEYVKGYGELKLYVRLAPLTPELAPYKDRRIQGRLVTSLHDPVLERLCRQDGLEYQAYTPSFWAEYQAVLRARERRPIRPEEAQTIGGA